MPDGIVNHGRDRTDSLASCSDEMAFFEMAIFDIPGLDVSDILTYRTARFSDRKTGVVGIWIWQFDCP